MGNPDDSKNDGKTMAGRYQTMISELNVFLVVTGETDTGPSQDMKRLSLKTS
jgi:hypothetical protein